MVGDNFDITQCHNGKDLERIDMFLTTKWICNLLPEIYEDGCDYNWAREYPEEADLYFGRPYPDVIVDKFGYDNHVAK